MEVAGVALVVAQIAGALLAAAIATRAARDHARVRAPALRRFALGFALLALSQVAAAALEIVAGRAEAVPAAGVGVLDALFWTHYGSLVVGLAALLASFDRPKLRLVLVAAPIVLVAGPALQLVAVLLLLLVVLHAGLNHIERARRGTLVTTAGFLLLLAGHATFLVGYAPLTPHHLPGAALILAGMVLLALAARRGAR